MPGVDSKTPTLRDGSDIGFYGRVAEFLDTENRVWNIERAEQLFSTEDTIHIQDIQFPLVECEDKLCWSETGDEKFSVKNAYALINGEVSSGKEVWGLIWNSNLHERLKVFLWRLASDILPLNTILNNRLGGGDVNCRLCGQGTEEFFSPIQRFSSVLILCFH